MRITGIHERAILIRSKQRNSRFDFSEMCTSVVAVTTDVVRGGRPLTGSAFNSFGRYACGPLLRDWPGAHAERAIPIGTVEAAPHSTRTAAASRRSFRLWEQAATSPSTPTAASTANGRLPMPAR